MANKAERRNVEVKSYSGNLYDLEGSLRDIVKWANDRLSEIPEEYRASERTDISSYERPYGGGTETEVAVYYTRPETGEELKNRLEDEAARAEAIRRRDMQQLEELKRKYEKA